VTPNAFAWLALGSWPVVGLTFFAFMRGRASLARTTAWAMLLPTMFLPAVLELPGPGHLNKHRMAFLVIWVALQLFHRRELAHRAPSGWLPRLVLLVMVAGVFFTVRTNSEPLVYGRLQIPGLDGNDFLSIVIHTVLSIYVPFAVGQQVFRTERDIRDLFEVLAICGLIYLPLALVELRLSPQFHTWVYGYFPSVFVESKRAGGFRPVVFMNHGLSVAMFAFVGFSASVCLARVRARTRPVGPRSLAATAGVLVVACKSLGAVLYSSAAAIVIPLGSAVTSGMATLLAIIVIAFPVSRAVQIFPADAVVGFFSRISIERADSLEFRFKHESKLVERAMAKPVFGWGTWGRNRVYTQEGRDTTILDGLWIALLGSFGWVGLAGEFALFVVPVFRFALRRRLLAPNLQILGSALALIVGMYALDFLPNNVSDYLPFAYAGALYSVSAPFKIRRRTRQERVVVGRPGVTPATRAVPS
jgi:hypothetical protein